MLGFLCAWVVLNAVLNVGYPTGRPDFYFLLPCIDLVVLFGGYVWLARRGRSMPLAAHVLLVLTFVLVRIFRQGDGLTVRFLRRPFHLHLDSLLVPELGRLLHVTSSPAFLALTLLVLAGGIALTAYASHVALRHVERSLAERANVWIFAIATSILLVLSAVPREGGAGGPLYAGAFAASGVARLGTEARLLWQVPEARAAIERRMAAQGTRLNAIPNDLRKLEGADVLLFLIESYGETVLRRPEQVARINPLLREFESELGRHGFSSVSSLLNSPTAGGGSWLAHATLATGVRVADQLAYDLLTLARPPTISDFFRRAGYRTVLVQPGTTRPPGRNGYLRFDQEYFAANFDYRGPDIGWGRYPDQYVVDFVHRKEQAFRERPRFIEYVLVTSHVPWSAEAPVLDDWSRIGDGSVFRSLPVTRRNTRWTSLRAASDAYTATIAYDLEVLKRYVTEFVRDDSLVIILGDHQPVGDVTGNSPDLGVPIHVLSRRRAFVDAFAARGYTRGMWPTGRPPSAGLETFLEAFLLDFSASRTETSH